MDRLGHNMVVEQGAAAQRGKRHFEAVDSLRGFAALAVALHHLQVGSHIYFWPLVRNAYIFVEFFFVLSGFVIAHAYHDRLDTRADVEDFAIRRIARIWPLHLVMLGAFLIAEASLWLILQKVSLPLSRLPFTETRTLAGVPINFFLLNGILPFKWAEWNGPSWSVSVEVLTYANFAGSVFWGKRSAYWLHLLFLSIGLATIILNAGEPNWIPRCFYSFFLGVSIWRYKDLMNKAVVTLVEICGLAISLALLTSGSVLTQLTVLPPIFGLLIVALSKDKGSISEFLKRKTCLFLGRISYSIYMVHFFVAFLLTNFIKVVCKLLHVPATMPGTDLAIIGRSGWIMDAVTIVYLMIVIAIASFTYSWIEKPGMELGKRLAKKVRAR
jgi:peptidoglycan/LPS O-acetylase OafA/YrhL